MRRATLMGLGLLLLAGAALAQASRADPARARIEKLGKDFAAAFNRGDVAAVANMYAENAMVFPPDSNVVRGRQAIQAVWQGLRDLGGKSMEFTILDLQSSGNMVVETGKAALTVQGAGAAQTNVEVKYVVVWQKQKAGDWKITHDIWNNMPTASMTAPATATSPTPAPHH